MEEVLTAHDALELLDDAHHAVLSEDTVQKVCISLCLEVPEKRVMRWETPAEAWEHLGFLPEVAPGSGIDGLVLVYSLLEQLGVPTNKAPGSRYSGRGFQHRPNMELLREKLLERDTAYTFIGSTIMLLVQSPDMSLTVSAVGAYMGRTDAWAKKMLQWMQLHDFPVAVAAGEVVYAPK